MTDLSERKAAGRLPGPDRDGLLKKAEQIRASR